MEQKTALSEDLGNHYFKKLLREFEAIIKDNPTPEKVKDKLKELAENAINSHNLTSRQTEAITDACKYYMAGEYGNTKRPEHFEQAKPSKKD
jgi:hypothetical protein